MEYFGLDLEQLLLWATVVSIVVALITLIAVPLVVTRLPCDYFSREQRAVWRMSLKEPALALLLAMFKNLLGLLLVILGLVMLVTPGQGLLTLLTGLLLTNFPGKYRLERWLVLRPGVLRGLNWLRRRQGQPPFDAPAA
jgi:hypothetical protein